MFKLKIRKLELVLSINLKFISLLWTDLLPERIFCGHIPEKEKIKINKKINNWKKDMSIIFFIFLLTISHDIKLIGSRKIT
ncbi:MAG: hypothetical protein WCJ54_03565 [Actinomycetota bacterium]